MSNAWTILRNGRNLLFLILLLPTCAASPEKATPKVHTVEIKGMKFQPAELKVLKGDTVVWINRDIVVHDVTEEKSKAWTSSPITTGKSWRMVVTKNSNYFCSIHQVMKGRLLVQ